MILSLKELPERCLLKPGMRSASSDGAKGPGKMGGKVIWERARTAVLQGRRYVPKLAVKVMGCFGCMHRGAKAEAEADLSEDAGVQMMLREVSVEGQ